MDLGVWNMEPKIFPRIRCFSADRIRSLILADTLFPGDSYRLPEFGKSQLRKVDGVPYVWARMRSEQFKLASAWEAAICVARTLLVPMEATGPIFFAIADFEGRCGDLVRCGGLHFVTALFAIIDPFIRGYRYSCSSAVNPSGLVDAPLFLLKAQEFLRKRRGYHLDGTLQLAGIRGEKCSCACHTRLCSAENRSQFWVARARCCAFCGCLPSADEFYSLREDSLEANAIVRRVMSKYYWGIRQSNGFDGSDMPSTSSGLPDVNVGCDANVHAMGSIPVKPWDLGLAVDYNSLDTSQFYPKLLNVHSGTMNSRLSILSYSRFMRASMFKGDDILEILILLCMACVYVVFKCQWSLC